MWTFDRIPALGGKVFIVTGSNSGIGRVTARELARKGAHVIMACRSESKTAPVLAALRLETDDAGTLEFASLDLQSLRSVDAFADSFLRRGLPLHGLVLNAGIMAHPFGLSADGIETQFATNHVAHFHLTQRLLPCLEASAPSRVVVLSSSLHSAAPQPEGIRFDRINDQKSYKEWTAYGQSKLANILFAKELNARLLAKGQKNVYVNAVHPGRVFVAFSRLGFLAKPISWLFYATNSETIGEWSRLLSFHPNVVYHIPDEDKGASTSLYLATDPEVSEKDYRGLYFGPIAKILTPAIPQATDAALAKRLWDFTEDLVKEKLAK
ncbi:hypothetical protein DFJ73DRAFT_912862 [Zopfochytrium polystomum]|nr:hypothetical protein DFJ73DRAFT_912862 [Zopfochytrium polystomum]